LWRASWMRPIGEPTQAVLQNIKSIQVNQTEY
jgi:hypothetical protein